MGCEYGFWGRHDGGCLVIKLVPGVRVGGGRSVRWVLARDQNSPRAKACVREQIN